MTLRRETIVIALGLLLIAAAIPFAISETIEKGRVCLFSRQFLEELPQRFTGPGRFRFILQPTSWAGKWMLISAPDSVTFPAPDTIYKP